MKEGVKRGGGKAGGDLFACKGLQGSSRCQEASVIAVSFMQSAAYG
jgi:hypothetical protein